jgi:hypothetical protein
MRAVRVRLQHVNVVGVQRGQHAHNLIETAQHVMGSQQQTNYIGRQKTREQN